MNHVTANLPAAFDDLPNNDITVEAQVRYTGTGFTRVFFAQKDAGNYFNISMTNFSGQLELYTYVAVTGTVHSVRVTQGLTLGQNHHIAARWTAATATIDVFIDGQPVGVSFGGDSSAGTNNMMTIGARTDGFQTFNGEIDELAIWNEARLLCLLVQDANDGVNPATPNLLAYYTFNQGVAGGNNAGITTLTDETGNFPGTLQNFALSGTTSNFVTSSAFSAVLPAPNTSPVAVCTAPFTIQLDANGEASITVNDIDDGSFDPCGIDSITIDKSTFTCADVGPNTITLTITALNGNTDTCTTIVTVEDTIDPVAQCVAPFTIQLDVNGQASITPAMIDNGSTDNCAIASLTLDTTDFTCADLGANTVTLTVTDTNGNTATCTTVVTVEDTVAPEAICAAPFT
ncbi:MAG: LamG domain-containing protein, partial [Salibacteraceae bacterium]